MPSEKKLREIETYIQFARRHAVERYGANLDAVGDRVLNGELVYHMLGMQNGLFLDTKIGSRQVKGRYGIPNEDKIVLLGDLGDESEDKQYFGVVFHEFGHATFDALGKNSEHGAFCMELTALVDAVVADVVPLGIAQTYTAARIKKGMLSEKIAMVKNKEWETRYSVSRAYLSNASRVVMSSPGGYI